MFSMACFFSVQSIRLELFDFMYSALRKKEPVSWNLLVCSLMNSSSPISLIFKLKWWKGQNRSWCYTWRCHTLQETVLNRGSSI